VNSFVRDLARGAIAAVLAVSVAGVAQARNPHCAGGIQYVTQAMGDKEKGNKDDYLREIRKAVQQLEQCSTEDPADAEAVGYLAFAYAEVDSSALAGQAFAKAISLLTTKGDKKKIDWATTNRDHFWTLAFNEGIAKITSAQTAYPDFCKKPENASDEALKAEAAKQYEAAVASLTRASRLIPTDARNYRNLGAVYAFQCQFSKADATFQNGLKMVPGDSSLTAALASVRVNLANSMVDEKNYDQAITIFGDLSKTSPNDANVRMGLADAYFKRAQTREGAARKGDFKAAGDAYAKAGELKPGTADLPFNAALAYQQAEETVLAEAQWRLAVKYKPDDMDALSSLGATLADESKFDEAIQVLHEAVLKDPKNKTLHRQLGSVYQKAGKTEKGREELMVFLALRDGQPVADAAATAKQAAAGSAPANALKSDGVPEQIIAWEADKQKYLSWFYWSKKTVYHFSGGTLMIKSDWSTTAAPGSK